MYLNLFFYLQADLYYTFDQKLFPKFSEGKYIDRKNVYYKIDYIIFHKNFILKKNIRQ